MKATAYLAAVVLAFQCPTTTASTPENPRAAELLLKLFPGASTQELGGVFGSTESVEIVYPVSLRGRHGFIRVADARVQPVGEAHLAIAFEVFLTTERDVRRWATSPAPRSPAGALKLLQIVVFDKATRRFIGKPEGFPLEGDGWTCAGDTCSIPSLVELTAGAKKDPYVLLRYATGVDRQLVRVVAVGANRTPIASRATAVGDLGGESGCHVSASFRSFKLEGRHVVGLRQSECDPGCPEICKGNDLPPGKHEAKVILLTLE